MTVVATSPVTVTTQDGSKIVENGQLTCTGSLIVPVVVNAANLPTADPHVAGQLWASTGVVTVSAG